MSDSQPVRKQEFLPVVGRSWEVDGNHSAVSEKFSPRESNTRRNV